MSRILLIGGGFAVVAVSFWVTLRILDSIPNKQFVQSPQDNTVIAATPAPAGTVAMKTDLKASNELPPNDSKGSGTMTVTYDTVSKKLSWRGSYSGLTGKPTAANFHGPTGAVTVAIEPNPSPFEGSATLIAAQAADLMAGRWYVNIHTAAHPSGEIRGQVLR